MKEQLVSLETAKLAEEKGFKLPYPTACYTEEAELYIIAPTQSLLQKWLREKHNIIVESNFLSNIQKYRCFYKPKNIAPKDFIKDNMGTKEFYTRYYSRINCDTYEEALEIGLIEALALI